MENSLLERLAALEHEQWIEWTHLVVGQERNNEISLHLLKKWEKNWIPYDKLPENLKEFDRVWARRVIDIIHKAGVETIEGERNRQDS